MNFFKNKYRSEKVNHAGLSFASKLEAAIYDILELRRIAGVIESIQTQDTIYLTSAKIIYKPDFKCTLPGGGSFWVEAKGFKTPVWAIKKRLWEFYGPGELEIWEGSYTRPRMSEIIKPKKEK